MKLVPGFTEKYNLDKLVYFEKNQDIVAALEREKECSGCRLQSYWERFE
ncbi:putative GIY-YIG superfamily endonuclease [Desulfoprunum benzoelyticum]|uniref:Putative GIY-YIG superfamily endonuclease n=1 Tax=Desulfoprunum benzoelyticum TaxID=1506996 RepID=A0A840USL2_9BACT|nr:putative GIY-YIG superfamily endonuclease [Desulfoprunum benzoelyticum]